MELKSRNGDSYVKLLFKDGGSHTTWVSHVRVLDNAILTRYDKFQRSTLWAGVRGVEHASEDFTVEES